MKKIILLILVAAVFIAAAFLAGCNNEQPLINSIDIYTAPVTVYLQGQDLDLRGAQIVVRYADNTEQYVTITDDMISNYDKNLLGQQYVVITYQGKNVSLPITIVSPRLDSIDIATLPNKTVYKQEQLFKIDGCTITVNYEGGAKSTMPVTETMLNLDQIDMNETGVQVVTVTYTLDGVSRTATFNITILPKVLLSMEVTAVPDKTIYYVGEQLQLDGGEIFFAYDNGYSERVPMPQLYNNGNGSLSFEWDNNVISDRSIVTAVYQYADPTAEPGSASTIFRAHFDVTVTERDIRSIENISVQNEYNEYPFYYQTIGMPINLNGLRLRLTYNNNETETLVFSDSATDPLLSSGRVQVLNYDNTVIGYQEITLIFFFGDARIRMNTSYTLSINVNNKRPVGIRLILPQGTIYQDGIPCFYQDTPVYPFRDPANGIEGWKYVIVYDNGTESDTEYDLLTSMFKEFGIRNGIKFSTAGDAVWNMKYYEIPDFTFSFRVLPKLIVSSSIRLSPGYRTYYGFALNVDGIMLDLTYNNGAQETVYVTAGMITQYDPCILGTQTIKVRYANQFTSPSGFETEGIVTSVKKVKAGHSLGFRTLPLTEYIRDQKLVLTGAEITIQYDEGGSAATEILRGEDLLDDWVMLETQLIEGAVTFRNSDGWTLTLPNVSPSRKLTAIGSYNVFLSYEGLSSFELGAGYTIHVTDPVDNIVLVTPLDDVFAGQALNLQGKYIRVYYVSGRYENVALTGSMVNYNPRNLKAEIRTVTISYTDPNTGDIHTIDTQIEVFAKALRSISLVSAPVQTEYLFNSNDNINYAGLKLMFCYNNGSSDIVEVTEDNFSDFVFENFDTSIQMDAREIRVIYVNYNDIPRENNYEEIFTTFNISVKDQIITSLRWSGASAWPVINAEEGQNLTENDISSKVSGFTVLVKNSGSDDTEERTLAEMLGLSLRLEGYKANTAITQHVKLVYIYNKNLWLDVEVRITPRVLYSITFPAQTKPLTVIENNDISLTEYKLILNYSNDTSETISMIQAYIVKSPDNPGGYDKNDTRIGERSVSIMYTENGVTCYLFTTIDVRAKQLTGIGVKTLPKIKYIEGEELDLTGGKVSLFYNNGSQMELNMTDATTSVFYVNRNKFDSNEFSGVSKLQTIYIIYEAEGQKFTTHFDIIMQDRKTPVVVFDAQNRYEFTYGASAAPGFSVFGYADYNQTEATMLFGPDRLAHVRVRYVNVNEYNNQDPNKDYTVLPYEVGEYYIVVSYDADPNGYTRDSIHNSFLVVCPSRLIIRKRPIYVIVDGIEKIYGTANPNYVITFVSEDKYRNPSLTTDRPFAYNDTYLSANFIMTSGDQSDCYDKSGNLITCFLFTCVDRSALPIGVNTAVGSYQITASMGTSVSRNYNIVFVNNYFVIKARDVFVTPVPVTAEYGDRNILFRYTVSGRPGDPNSGLYGTDTLSGSPSRVDANNYNIGRYAITKGTLSNPNYNIIFINDTASDGGANGIYLTIYQRKLYIKVNSRIISYGDAVPVFGSSDITLYRDDVCTITDGALAMTDTYAMLLGTTGQLTFSHNVVALSNVGKYPLTVAITGVTLGSVLSNYDITYIPGYIEIKQKQIYVQANPASKIYGDQDPELTYTVLSQLPSGVLQGHIARQTGEHIGVYAITSGTLSSSNPNYKIEFTGATFEITSRSLIARIDPAQLTKVFDGRIPSPPAFSIYQIVNGQEVPVSSSFNTSFISITIADARRDTGSYNLVINNTNANYTVSFPAGTNYKYTITKRSVNVNIVIPDSLPYKGEGYVFDAYVPDSEVQRFYNSNGTVMVDEFNNEIKDQISVILQFTTGSKAVFVGNYEVYVSALISENDNYQINGSISRTFTITPRPLTVTMKPSVLTYGNTIEKEYNNQYVAIKADDYVLSNTIPGSSDEINFSIKVISIEHGLDTAKNVIFNSDGTVGSYDIVVVQPSNNNYTVALAAPYKYKITPKNAKITIASKYLTRAYDGSEPRIDDFSKVSTLAKSSVVFTFTRDANDGRKNTEVGVYNISVSSTDPNHTVYLAANYQFTLTKANVNVNMKTASKSYDGQPVNILYNQLNVATVASGSEPYVRSFSALPIYNGQEIIGYTDVETIYSEFQSTMTQMVYLFSRNREKANNILFDDLGLASLRIAEAKNSIQESLIYLTAHLSVLKGTSSYANCVNYLNQATGYLNAIGVSTTADERNANLNSAKTRINSAYDIIEKENTYLAFVFTPLSAGSDPTATNAGEYRFSFRQNDFNRNYNYNSSLLTYVINKQEVYLGVFTYSKVYGTILQNPVQGSPDYYAYETSKIVNGNRVVVTLPNFNPLFEREDSNNFNVGRYSISFIDTETLGNNYRVLVDKNTSLGYTWEFVITPSLLTIQINNTGYGAAGGSDYVEYGTKITQNLVNKWSYVSGLTSGDLQLVSEGGVVSQTLLTQYIINAGTVVYTARKILGESGGAYILGNDVISDMNAKPSTGEYQISATNFASANYTINVLPGLMKISKANLTINAGYNNSLSRIYGDALILSFGGFMYSDYINVFYNYQTNDYYYTYNLGEDGGTFTVPTNYFNVNLYNENPFALQTSITEAEGYIVGFDWTPAQAEALKNYNLTGIYDQYGQHIEYRLFINKATLTMYVTNADNPAISPETIYGELPNLNFSYSGFKNNDAAALVFSNPSYEGLRLRNTWDPKLLTSYDFTFSQDALLTLKNYNVVLAPNINLNVIKRQLYVRFNKDISVMYNASSDPKVQISYFAATLSGTEYTVVSGQYYYGDILFTNTDKYGTSYSNAGFANGDTATTIFNCYGDSEKTYTIGDTTYYYIDYTHSVRHTLVYNQCIGENQTISLSGLSFVNGSQQNYQINYETTRLNVYGNLASLSISDGDILLNGDSVDNFTMKATYEDNSVYYYSYQELRTLPGAYNVSISPSSLPANLNRNFNLTVTFNRTYTLTPYNGPTTMDDYPVNNGLTAQQTIPTVTNTIRARIYDTSTSLTPVSLSGYTYRNDINATGNTSGSMYTLSAANAGYDYIEVSLRMVPSKTETGFQLWLNGIDSASYLVFKYDHTDKLYKLNISGTDTELSLPNIDLLDGFTHTIRAYFDKRLQILYLYIDNYAYAQIAIPSFTFASNEVSKPQISFYGMHAWVRNFAVGYIGYYDRIATRAKISESLPLSYYLTTSDTVTVRPDVVLKSSISDSVSAARGYVNVYKLNGEEVSASENQILRSGTYHLELTIWHGVNVVDRCAVVIHVSYAAVVSSVKEKGGSIINSNILPSNPAAFKSYTDGDNDDLIDNLQQEYHTYELASSRTAYTSLTLSLSMKVAKMEGIGGGSPYYRATNAKTFVTLWGNDSSYAAGYQMAAGYYGIALSYERDANGGTQITRLNVTFGNGVNYYNSIPGVNWESETEYTAKLYIDKTNPDAFGGASVKFLLYNGSSEIYSCIIREGSLFTNSNGVPVSETQIKNLIGISGCQASIISADTKLTISRAQYGFENKTVNDYIIGGAYQQSSPNGVAVSSGKVYLSDNTGSACLSAMGESSVKFAFNGGIGSADFKFVIAATDKSSDGRAYVIEYIGSEQKLYFYFIDNTVIYKKQLLASGINLATGTHTISAKINRTAVEETGNLGGLLSYRSDPVGNGASVYYHTVSVKLDGMAVGNGKAPYYNSTLYWMTDNNDFNSGLVPGMGYFETFMDNYVYCYLDLTSAPILLYGLESAMNSTSEHLL